MGHATMALIALVFCIFKQATELAYKDVSCI
ncbi:hypothetical protein ACB094_09G052200 [Castanea mollissima]